MDEKILHYRILRRLETGGPAEDYLAEDERRGGSVVLHVLPRSEAGDPGLRERLHREARSLASLEHPNIAAVRALEEHEGRLVLVTEYVESETLADRLARRPLPVWEVTERGLAIAEALAYAHGRGVIHRDVQPANVLTPDERTTKLTGFALALRGGVAPRAADAPDGTAEYRSPEQTRSGSIDARSDLFSLGVVLYQALTEVRPFARRTPEDTAQAIQADEPEPPSALRNGIPPSLELAIMRCLRKDPAERHTSAESLAADLRALRSQLPPAEPPPEPSTPSGHPRRRGIPAIAVIGTVLLVIAALAQLLVLRCNAR